MFSFFYCVDALSALDDHTALMRPSFCSCLPVCKFWLGYKLELTVGEVNQNPKLLHSSLPIPHLSTQNSGLFHNRFLCPARSRKWSKRMSRTEVNALTYWVYSWDIMSLSSSIGKVCLWKPLFASLTSFWHQIWIKFTFVFISSTEYFIPEIKLNVFIHQLYSWIT